MNNLIYTVVYDERKDAYNKIKYNSPLLTKEQVDEILNGFNDEWNQYVISFYDNGMVTVFDLLSNQTVDVEDLIGLPYDFIHNTYKTLYGEDRTQREGALV